MIFNIFERFFLNQSDSVNGHCVGDSQDPRSKFVRIIQFDQILECFDKNILPHFFRIFSIFVVIPLWLAIGGITAGWLWPPQVREWLFVQKETAIGR